MKWSSRRDICEPQHQRCQRQRQRHGLRILLVKQGKISMLHVRHVFYNNSASSFAKPQLEITRHFRIRFGAKLKNIFIFVLFECIYIVIASLNFNIWNSEILVPLALLLNSRQNKVLVNTLSVLNNNKPEYFPLTIYVFKLHFLT